MRVAAFATGLAVAAATFAPASASAGCTDEVVANVAMAPGRSCWVYRGPATVFTGEFGGGQRIAVHMSNGHLPNASGPGGFFTESGGGSLGFFAPQGGIYRFSFYPCALWGQPAAVEICAR